MPLAEYLALITLGVPPQLADLRLLLAHGLVESRVLRCTSLGIVVSFGRRGASRLLWLDNAKEVLPHLTTQLLRNAFLRELAKAINSHNPFILQHFTKDQEPRLDQCFVRHD